ncbi:MAG: hypothetical protein IPM36_02620 [Lewinellaceae bacterium]|nr:hypothetical protein [Lewinellaceae bacterium]
MLTIKSCLTAIFLCSLLSQINAQLNAEIGVIGGMIRPSLHNFEGSAIAPYDPMQPAPMGGLGFSFRLFKPLYFRTEFIYEERRWEPANVTVVFPEDGTLGLASISRRYPFLTMPFLLELRYGKRVQLFGNT